MEIEDKITHSKPIQDYHLEEAIAIRQKDKEFALYVNATEDEQLIASVFSRLIGKRFAAGNQTTRSLDRIYSDTYKGTLTEMLRCKELGIDYHFNTSRKGKNIFHDLVNPVTEQREEIKLRNINYISSTFNGINYCIVNKLSGKNAAESDSIMKKGEMDLDKCWNVLIMYVYDTSNKTVQKYFSLDRKHYERENLFKDSESNVYVKESCVNFFNETFKSNSSISINGQGYDYFSI